MPLDSSFVVLRSRVQAIIKEVEKVKLPTIEIFMSFVQLKMHKYGGLKFMYRK